MALDDLRKDRLSQEFSKKLPHIVKEATFHLKRTRERKFDVNSNVYERIVQEQQKSALQAPPPTNDIIESLFSSFHVLNAKMKQYANECPGAVYDPNVVANDSLAPVPAKIE
jgi:hypothetical protein